MAAKKHHHHAKPAKKSGAKKTAKRSSKRSAKKFRTVANVGPTPRGKVRWLGRDGKVYERDKSKAKKRARR